jgi:hypothetical protein
MKTVGEKTKLFVNLGKKMDENHINRLETAKD